MIILKFYSQLNVHQFMENDSKYEPPKQMLSGLAIAFAQVKAENNSENLLNEIRQIVYVLYQSKEITKKSIQKHNYISIIIN